MKVIAAPVAAKESSGLAFGKPAGFLKRLGWWLQDLVDGNSSLIGTDETYGLFNLPFSYSKYASIAKNCLGYIGHIKLPGNQYCYPPTTMFTEKLNEAS